MFASKDSEFMHGSNPLNPQDSAKNVNLLNI
jgi:hypothetical protein